MTKDKKIKINVIAYIMYQLYFIESDFIYKKTLLIPIQEIEVLVV